MTARARPALAALGLPFAALALGLATRLSEPSDSSLAASSPAAPAAATAAVTTTAVTTTAGPSTTVTSPPTTTTTTVVEATTLSAGMSGPEVLRLQSRLTELGFALGPVDGYFGELTTSAVWAFEKLVLGTPSNEVTGVVTPAMWERIATSEPPAARRHHAGYHTEIYLPEQVLAVFDGAAPVFIAHMSSGDGAEWIDEVTISPGEYGNEHGSAPLTRMEQGRSDTPGGVFEYHRAVSGIRQSALGDLLNPVYFNYGIAVHGAANVPEQPASHGCVRIANPLSEEFQTLVDIGQSVYVWDGEHEPEYYGAQLPPFNTVLPTSTTVADG